MGKIGKSNNSKISLSQIISKYIERPWVVSDALAGGRIDRYLLDPCKQYMPHGVVMETREAIHAIKDRIKELAVLQHKAKRARKTTIPSEERNSLMSECGIENSAATYVFYKKAEITALLNFYHELRGSEYRHDVRKGLEYYYDEEIKKLREEYTK